MANRWEAMEIVTDFIFLVSKLQIVMTATKLKDVLSLEKRTMTNLVKSRDITLPRKVRIVKAMVFPVGIYGCKIWTIKKAEH